MAKNNKKEKVVEEKITLEETPIVLDEIKEEPIEEIPETPVVENTTEEETVVEEDSPIEESTEEVKEEEPIEESTEEVKEEEPIEIKEEIPEIKLDEVEESKEEEIQVIGLNNKPINLDAVGDITAPRGFVPIHTKTKVGQLGCYKGRTYQLISKDVAIWCDNGKQFNLSQLI